MTRTAQRTRQILVAGIGNAWLRDDGFGGEVAKVLADRELPPGVHVIDFGTGGLDLAYEVMRGYDALILIAGIGNAWMGDDGFGSEVVKRLGELELPRGVAVMDFGTGGLNLAYEVMRGYDALMMLDISEQGGTPGTLYVIEADEETIDGSIEDGATINPHGMDPKTMLRFVKSIGAWPGKVVVIACEPQTVAEIGFQLSESVAGAVEPAVQLVLETIAELRTDAAYLAQPAD